MTQKVQISQDVLYTYITEHGIKLVRLAELMGMSGPSVTSCFKHQLINNGTPRSFTPKAIRKLNVALGQIAESLRGCILTFGSEETHTNSWGNTYDPALIEPMKKIGEHMNLTALVERVLGWNERKKVAVLTEPHSKAYGRITEDDANRINAELLSVAGVLSSYEVVADDGSSSSDNNNAKPLKDSTKRKTMESSYEAPKYEWDDTSLNLPERSALLRQRWPNGMLLFRVNGGYTAEGDDAQTVHDLLPEVQPYTDPASGMTTAYMSEEQMTQVLSQFIAQGRRVMITNMYKE